MFVCVWFLNEGEIININTQLIFTHEAHSWMHLNIIKTSHVFMQLKQAYASFSRFENVLWTLWSRNFNLHKDCFLRRTCRERLQWGFQQKADTERDTKVGNKKFLCKRWRVQLSICFNCALCLEYLIKIDFLYRQCLRTPKKCFYKSTGVHSADFAKPVIGEKIKGRNCLKPLKPLRSQALVVGWLENKSFIASLSWFFSFFMFC